MDSEFEAGQGAGFGREERLGIPPAARGKVLRIEAWTFGVPRDVSAQQFFFRPSDLVVEDIQGICIEGRNREGHDLLETDSVVKLTDPCTTKLLCLEGCLLREYSAQSTGVVDYSQCRSDKVTFQRLKIAFIGFICNKYSES